MFYNLEGQHAGVAYLTLNDARDRFVDFNNISIVSYDGVNMLVSVPEGLAGVGQ
jgi:hypothetical protein